MGWGYVKKLANEFVNHPLIYYVPIIEKASYLVLADSSFFCLSFNLNIQTDRCYYVPRTNAISYDYIYQNYPPPEYLDRKRSRNFNQRESFS